MNIILLVHEKIGNGSQFEIYDLDNGKVLRKRKSRNKINRKCLFLYLHYIFTPWKIRKRLDKSIRDRESAINNLSKNKFKRSLLANIEFEGKNIFQDKVVPINKALSKDLDINKKIIDYYVNLLTNCMKEGFLEREYNFQRK